MKHTGLIVAAALLAAGCSGTAQADPRQYPASSGAPAAGICSSASGHTVTVRLLGDMSDARCYEVQPRQRIRFVNTTGRTVRVRGGSDFPSFTLAPHRSRVLKGEAGSYLAPGDHGVGSSMWCCFGFDIVLPGAPATSSSMSNAG